MQINLKLQGQFLDKVAKAPAEAKSIIEDGLVDASTHLFQTSQENAPASTGALRQGMREEIQRDKLRAEIYPSSKYAMFVHGPGGEGRTKPHWIPGKEAMAGGALYRWAKKKGANPWAVRAAIAKKGTKFQPWLEKTAKSEEGKVLAIISSSIQNIARFLGD